jgi:ubiquinone/menaquinone biosynthesis C-methylase UbiE
MEPVNYDRAVGFYDETRGFPPGEEDPIAALIAEVGQLTPVSRVLEIGIGTGRMALPITKYVGSPYTEAIYLA